ncbi:MAG: Stage III sporulation protein AC/AD protein family protein [Firmicutes bacterium ADurb.Bin506]|jgi:stage III sporulation protein AC|nr:MAG: Stage III sporulation protein AC/AD protein family protein [Firmicutes bacterium ADurb.Bin506]
MAGLDLILRIAGIGILVSVLCAVLKQQGKDEYSLMVGTAGLIIVLLMLVEHLSTLLSTVRTVFKLW